MKCRVDPEPIHGFASLSQGNLDVANEVSLGRTSLGLFQIGADGCSRFQQLIDQSTYAWPLIESQGETRDSTPELKGTIANVLRAIRHARGECTRRAIMNTRPLSASLERRPSEVRKSRDAQARFAF